MFYDIDSLCPRGDIHMGSHGFSITLYPQWKSLVVAAGLDQGAVDRLLLSMGRLWLDACGYNAIFDPDNCGADADRSKEPGPEARPLYEPLHALSVRWGEWGPEHITVPGNACGLDIDHGSLGGPEGSQSLLPHNIDNWSQKNLLLIVFTHIAQTLSLMGEHNAD